MAIGTTLKVSFDASPVKAGMKAINSLFTGTMRGMRQVGIGAARQVGAGMTDMMGRVLTAIPDSMNEMMDWVGGLYDMSNQTKVGVAELVVLEEALRLSGAEANDTSRILSTLAKNLFDARSEAGPARDALHKLGLIGGDFRDLSLSQSFELLGKTVANLPADFEGLEGIMADLFGARMGYKLIRFFSDFNGGMEEARSNVGTVAERVAKSTDAIERLGDDLGRWQMVKREAALNISDALTAAVGNDWGKTLMETLKLDTTTLTNTIRAVLNPGHMGDTLDFTSKFKELGRIFAEGFTEGISAGSVLKGIFGFGGNKQADNSGAKLIEQGSRQIALLQTLTNKRTGWA
jgi:hypothetical protein